MSAREEEDFCLEAFQVEEQLAGLRLDRALSCYFPDYSRSYFEWLIEEGRVEVNGCAVKKRMKLALHDRIAVHFVITPEAELQPEAIHLEILYEDEYLLVINKPRGMVVHPAPGNWQGTFVNALLFHCSELSLDGTLRPGVVHRLDKDTSGVLVAAKNLEVLAKMSAQFKNRLVKKTYRAIALGQVSQELTIDAPIGRHPTLRKAMTVVPEKGKAACTYVRTIATNGELSLLELELKTGRTHQVRVHLKHAGHPVLGDALYGREAANAKWQAQAQMLHAHTITFSHPKTQEELFVEAPLPQDMDYFVQLLSKKYESCRAACKTS
jgi:23S rRNA pseudouridine1911/1915/1917 synthase